jgi:hypothetical protein
MVSDSFVGLGSTNGLRHEKGYKLHTIGTFERCEIARKVYSPVLDEKVAMIRSHWEHEQNNQEVLWVKEDEFIEINHLSISEIQHFIKEWINSLKVGDDVYVILSAKGWHVDFRNYFGKVVKVTPKRIEIDGKKQFHKDTGYIVEGVNGSGMYQIFPLFMNPYELELAWNAINFLSTIDTYLNVPVASLLAVQNDLEKAIKPNPFKS